MGGRERTEPESEDHSAYRTLASRFSGQLSDRQAIAAFLSYLALSVLIFGRGVLAHPCSVYLGHGPDAQQYIWFIAWWAHAISHHLNPFLTTVVWAPSGGNLAWATDFPLAACLLYPLTRLWGPILSSNVLHLIAPPLAGWSTFVLCRYVMQLFWPAWLGGWIFTFSPYMLTGMIGSVFLMLVFPLPLAVWATLRRLAGEAKARELVTTLVALLVAQFLMSPEIFASAALFGAIAIALGARPASTGERVRLRSVASSIILAYAVSTAILLPYLYYMFAFGMPRGLIFPPWQVSIDLINFFVPTSLNQLGNLPLFGPIAHKFLNPLSESGGYMCLPLLAIIALFVRERWRERRCRFMVYMLGCACVLATGPLLEMLGHRVLPLPAAALLAVPLLDKSLPARFMVYTYLVLAVTVAMWLAEETEQKGKRTLRFVLGVTIVPFMLPNLSAAYWATPAAVPAFFSAGLYRQYLTPGQNVMVLPYGLYGEGMLWQATTDMYFRMADGYVGLAPWVPKEHIRWPIMAGLYNAAGVPQAGEQLKAYLANHGVEAVIVGPRRQYRVGSIDGRPTPATWLRAPTLAPERDATSAMLGSRSVPAIEAGGVTLYRLTPQTLAPYRKLTALAMEQRAEQARFEALLLAAQRYLEGGGDLASLSPEHAQQLGLLPQGWFGGTLLSLGDSNPAFHSGVVLRTAGTDGIAVGVEGWYDALRPIMRRYGIHATQIYFPYPVRLSSVATPPGAATREDPALMVLTFDRASMNRAAASARRIRCDEPKPAPS